MAAKTLRLDISRATLFTSRTTVAWSKGRVTLGAVPAEDKSK